MDKQAAIQLWSTAAKVLKSENPVAFENWFKNLEPIGFDGKKLTLKPEHLFALNIIQRNHLDQIERVLCSLCNDSITCELVLTDHPVASAPAQDVRSARPVQTPVSQSQLNPRYTFSSFVIGQNNAMAHAAARKVAQNPGEAFNPLFLYSGVGLGKTHLMHAIGHEILQRNPETKIMYITSETFTVELIQAITNNTNFEFRNRYRNVDVLMIDDIQFLAGTEFAQEEMFHTFNALHGAAKQIVISSDRPPKEIPTLEDRLRTRFEWGLLVDVKPPDLETRYAILKNKADMDHYDVGPDVLMFIAENVRSNIRELEGCLNRVMAYANLKKLPASVELTREALADMLPGSVKKEVTLEHILKVVADYYSVSVENNW